MTEFSTLLDPIPADSQSPMRHLFLYNDKFPPFDNHDIWMGVALSHMFASSCEWLVFNCVIGNPSKPLAEGLEEIDLLWQTYENTYGSWMQESEVFEDLRALIPSAVAQYIGDGSFISPDFWEISYHHHARKYFGQTWDCPDLQKLAIGYLQIFSYLMRVLVSTRNTLTKDIKNIKPEGEHVRDGQVTEQTVRLVAVAARKITSGYRLSTEYNSFFELNMMLPEIREIITHLLLGKDRYDIGLRMAASIWDMLSPQYPAALADSNINNYLSDIRTADLNKRFFDDDYEYDDDYQLSSGASVEDVVSSIDLDEIDDTVAQITVVSEQSDDDDFDMHTCLDGNDHTWLATSGHSIRCLRCARTFKV